MQNLTRSSKLLYSKHQVSNAIDQMSSQIATDLEGKQPIMLCVVNGGIYLMGQLMQRLEIALEIDYIHVSRYNHKFEGNDINFHAKPKTNLNNRHVAIVDDVLDQGLTMRAINDWCLSQNTASIYNIVLIDKLNCRLPEGIQQADCTGLNASDEYLFGCGLDVKGFYRNLSEIYYVPRKHIANIEDFLPKI